ncbi:uncharacterized protein LOC141840073 [Curcuma longa]|uniref:uncharacterized protein LOC141840073 n=1 Tax=Curcuma longa TaxID=136217 RepID=UPI003D9E5BF9
MGFSPDPSPPSSPPSIKQRLRSSIPFSCCFRGSIVSATAAAEDQPASLVRSSAAWLRSKAQDLLEIVGQCPGLVPTIGRRHHHHRRSCDFRYDPLSYSLNFDEGPDEDDAILAGSGERPFGHPSFSSRLPPSSPPRPAIEVAC